MQQHVFTARDPAELNGALTRLALPEGPQARGSLLVQVYTMPYDQEAVAGMVAQVLERFPDAVIVGASTIGEIVCGRVETGRTLWIFTYFETTALTVLVDDCTDGEEQELGATLATTLHQRLEGKTPAGIFFLATPLSMDVPVFLAGFTAVENRCPLFGGGAGDYAAMRYSWILSGQRFIEQGVVMVALAGDELALSVTAFLGWKPLSREMVATKVEGLRVMEIDGEPALSVYQRYVNTEEGENFGVNAAEFPFLLERDGQWLARVPILAGNDGSLQFMADIQSGERFRLGYGDPGMILDGAREQHARMASFGPQGVLLFVCGARRFLMQEDSELETLPFHDIAPTAGFYTYGEFYGHGTQARLLNAALLVVGLREGPARAVTWPPKPQTTSQDVSVIDPYERQHAHVVKGLVRFIDAITRELEEKNRELERVSVTDRLTQLYNRLKMDQELLKHHDRACRYGESVSVAILDVDHFKRVNDEHGHAVGDAVLIKLADLLRTSLRSTDIVARWGGEEFIILFPRSTFAEAYAVADKVRRIIAEADFPVVGHKTASFGVATLRENESIEQWTTRADDALYRAKTGGRNAVCADDA